MKKYLLVVAISLSSFFAFAIPTEEVLEHFKSSFPNATEVSWRAEPDGGHLAVFKESEIMMRVFYNSDAEIIKTIRYYTESELLPFIKAKVKEKYKGKSIFGITELMSEGIMEYYIILEDEKKWYHVKSDSNGSMYIMKKYLKAPK